MLVAAIACLVGLVVVIVALACDDPPTHQAHAGTPLASAETARLDFPLVSWGYDPEAVEDYLDAVAHALADLLAAAPPEVVERARRLGLLGPETNTPDAGNPSEELPGEGSVQTRTAGPRTSTLDGASPDAEDHEALRAEAALVLIEAAQAVPFP